MRAGLALVTLLLAAGGCASAPHPPNRADLIRRILASTVQLRSEREGGTQRAASGVVVATDPASHRVWIVTVRHFLTPSSPQQVFVQLPGQERTVPATVMAVSAADLDLDLAILESQDLDVVPARLKEMASLGDEVLIAAFPWGERLTLVRGTVSQIASGSDDTLIAGPARMVDASVSYGSSGGGVFDARTGELVGLVETYRTAKITIPDLPGRTLSMPVPGETTIVPASVVMRFMLDFGLSRRLTR